MTKNTVTITALDYNIATTLAAVTLSDAQAYAASADKVQFTRNYLALGSGSGYPDSRVARIQAAFQALNDIDQALTAAPEIGHHPKGVMEINTTH